MDGIAIKRQNCQTLSVKHKTVQMSMVHVIMIKQLNIYSVNKKRIFSVTVCTFFNDCNLKFTGNKE